MVMPKPPKKFLVDSFIYKEYIGPGQWQSPEYAEPIPIEHCRIDRGTEYTSDRSGKQLLFNAVIFCYQDLTTPMPKFKNESIVIFDGIEHVITKVIPIYEAYENRLYGYELEVI